MPAPRKISHEQMELLLEYLEENKCLATSRCSREPERKQMMDRWEALATRLNLVNGYTKTAREWRNYWTEIKYHIRKKAAGVLSNTEMATRTRHTKLTDQDQRVLALVGLKSRDSKDSYLMVPAAPAWPTEEPLSSQLEPGQSAGNSQESAEFQSQARRHNGDPVEVRVTSGREMEYVVEKEDIDSDTSSTRLSEQKSLSRSRSPVAGRAADAGGAGAGAGAGRAAGWAVAGWARRLEERRLRTDADMARSLSSLAASAASQARSMQLMLELMNDFYETLQRRPPA